MDDKHCMLWEGQSEQLPSCDTVECVHSTELVGTINHIWKRTCVKGKGYLFKNLNTTKMKKWLRDFWRRLKIRSVDVLLELEQITTELVIKIKGILQFLRPDGWNKSYLISTQGAHQGWGRTLLWLFLALTGHSPVSLLLRLQTLKLAEDSANLVLYLRQVWIILWKGCKCNDWPHLTI